MTPLESMRLRMAETGLYTFSGQTAGTALDWELEAYNAGLELFYEQVKGLLENSFPETAGEDALSLWESLLGICGEGLAEEERRRRLLLRVSAVPGSNGGSHIHCRGAGKNLLHGRRNAGGERNFPVQTLHRRICSGPSANLPGLQASELARYRGKRIFLAADG